jgi:hypothetical protein
MWLDDRAGVVERQASLELLLKSSVFAEKE